MITKVLSPEQRKKELSRILRWRREALNQAVQALENRKNSIAEGVVEYLEETNPLIGDLVRESSRGSLYIRSEIQKLLAKEGEYSGAFMAAVKTGSISEARVIRNWLLDVDSALAALA